MSNPLYKPQQNGYAQIMQQVEIMRRNIKGNPQQIVQNLLNTGQMSQADFNRLAQMANQITGSMPKQ